MPPERQKGRRDVSTIPFWKNAAFWLPLAILTSFVIAGYRSANVNGMATPWQMMRTGKPRGLPFIAHLGFWSVALVVHPVLAWATARMWPLWQNHADLVAISILVGGGIGYKLQTSWSRAAGSDDAWSLNGRPNEAGIIHIQHMAAELGILVMLVLSLFWKDIRAGLSTEMVFGIVFIMVAHIITGTHWLLMSLYPSWRPEKMRMLSPPMAVTAAVLTLFALIMGFYLLSRA